MKKPSVFAVAALTLALGCSRGRTDQAQPPAGDPQLTALAQVLAGQAPADGSYADVTASQDWKNHAAFFQQLWPGVRDTRFKTAAEWRDKELNVPEAASATLHYPFSGPDFLNAQLFFPKADRYIFYSLEPTGHLPDLAAMKPEERAALFQEIQKALSDIFTRNYFITIKMSKDFHTKFLQGNRPLLLIFMALTDNRILSVQDVTVSTAGDVVPRSARQGGVDGVRIDFQNAAVGRPQTLYYFSLDVSNPGLDKRPEFVRFLEKEASGATLIKSASYLLQDPVFSHIRKTILDETLFLLQDDSGMPYRFLPKKDWDTALYGEYLGPKKDFKTGFQPDLDKAYKRPGAAKALPFHFGYHWEEGRESCVQVAVRKTAAAPSAAPDKPAVEASTAPAIAR